MVRLLEFSLIWAYLLHTTPFRYAYTSTLTKQTWVCPHSGPKQSIIALHPNTLFNFNFFY